MDIFTTSTAAAALAVALVHQVLKLKIVPLTFANRYPVPTNIILSVVAAVIVTHSTWAHITWSTLLVTVGIIAVTAALTYNQLLGRWAELKDSEG